MAKLTFRSDLCKGCGLCIAACPKGLLALAKDKINAKGHHPAQITEPEKCLRRIWNSTTRSAAVCWNL